MSLPEPHALVERPLFIGVIGGAHVPTHVYDIAYQVGRSIALNGAWVICGGLSGVMEAACKGAVGVGGTTVGILPGGSAVEANPYVTLPIVTAMAQARNLIIARSAAVLIAVGGSYGTLSEIGASLNVGTPVVSLGSWDVPAAGEVSPELFHATTTPGEAVRIALELARRDGE